MEDSSFDRSFNIFMKGCRRRLSLPTDSIKVAAVLVYIVLILHAVGFALPNWYQMEMRQTIIGSEAIKTERNFTYLVGLWRDCLCVNVMDNEVRNCATKPGFTGFLKRVQILETAGLVGFVISAGVCFILIFWRQQDRLLKTFNVLIVASSGACAVAGVIIFERENIGLEYNDAFDYIASISSDKNAIDFPEIHSKLTTSFILCTTAAGLCLFCVPLFIIDVCTRGHPVREEMRLIHVENIADGPFTIRQGRQQNSSTNDLQDQDQPLPFSMQSGVL